ncbi:MAG TPA: arylsulfatase [Planctomycetaceae bacterium]|nr:arylsulfatase [Planctomycetaceae bacterium]HRE99961.1 sulfatase [Pirellulaceae bacterium]
MKSSNPIGERPVLSVPGAARRRRRSLVAATVVLMLVALTGAISPVASNELPNIVVIVADDQGYGDIGVQGAVGFRTPNLDRLASEGVRFDSFYVSQAVCGASRASIMTGCYANRISWHGAPGPASRQGLHHDETTLAELLRPAGYATAFYGKWHLGHLPEFLPTTQGFDEYYGLPYSNDMWPQHPTATDFPGLPLIDGTTVIDPSVDEHEQSRLTEAYTRRAIDFIDRQRDRPFLLMVEYAMPHVPLFPGRAFVGSSEQGAYGDVIQEIDASVGRIVDAIDRHGLGERTLIVYTSDNGPWLSYGNHAGSAGPLREGKGTSWEGGVRVPCLMRMPGTLAAGRVVSETAATIDLLPTIASFAKRSLPERRIDGVDLYPLLVAGDRSNVVDRPYFIWFGTELQAVRRGKWKLVLPHAYRTLVEPGADGKPGPYRQQRCGLELYDLEQDLGETTDVAAANPEIVRELQQLADQARTALGDSLTGVVGAEVRAPEKASN